MEGHNFGLEVYPGSGEGFPIVSCSKNVFILFISKQVLERKRKRLINFSDSRNISLLIIQTNS